MDGSWYLLLAGGLGLDPASSGAAKLPPQARAGVVLVMAAMFCATP